MSGLHEGTNLQSQPGLNYVGSLRHSQWCKLWLEALWSAIVALITAVSLSDNAKDSYRKKPRSPGDHWTMAAPIRSIVHISETVKDIRVCYMIIFIHNSGTRNKTAKQHARLSTAILSQSF